MKTKLEEVARIMRKETGKNCVECRRSVFEKFCNKQGITFDYVGDRPHGRACKVQEMRDRYRVFVRCGYGRNNYAPCYEVRK